MGFHHHGTLATRARHRSTGAEHHGEPAAPRRSTAPRRCSAWSSSRGRRAASPPSSTRRAGPVHDLAAAAGARAQPLVAARPAPAVPRRPAVRADAARHDPLADLAELARPTLEQARPSDRRDRQPRRPARRGVVQVAQVDGRYVLGAMNWVGVDVPAHCSALGKVFYAYGALPAARRATRPPHRRTPVDRARARSRAESSVRAPRLGRRRSTSWSWGWSPSPPRSTATAASSPRLGVSGPTASAQRPRHRPSSATPARQPAAAACRHLLGPPQPRQGRSRMTPDEILKALYDETLVGNAPRVLELTQEGLDTDIDAGDDAVRRADPLARGGRRPVRARRLLRARDADRRPRDERRARPAAPAARQDRRPDRRHVRHGHRQGRRPRHRQEPGQHHARGRRLPRDRPRRAGLAGEVHRGDRASTSPTSSASRRSSPRRCRCSRPTSTRWRRPACATRSIVMVGGAPGHPGVRRRGRRRRLRRRRLRRPSSRPRT